jgi:hypothetical protein
MYEYRHVIDDMRKGVSDRMIASKGLMGRKRCKTFRELAQAQGWLDPTVSPPSEAQIASVLVQVGKPTSPPTAKAEPYCPMCQPSVRPLHSEIT